MPGRSWMLARSKKRLDGGWSRTSGNRQIFFGAYLVGYIIHLPDNFDFPTSSDVDIAVVLAQPDPENKPTKFLYRDVLIKVNYPPWSDFNSPEIVLGEYRRAGGFRPANILSDPSGEISRDIHVPSSVVNVILRVGFNGRLFPRLSAFSSAKINATHNTTKTETIRFIETAFVINIIMLEYFECLRTKAGENIL